MTDAQDSPTAAPRQTTAGGGVADKLGNKYELSWAVQHALRCLQDERRSITLEDLDPELAEGSEFTYVDEHGTITVTQVKRQQSINDHWTIAALRRRGIFEAAEQHVRSGREYHFNSMTPCGKLRVLSDWARQSADARQFVTRQLTKQLRPAFDELSAPNIFGSAEGAWRVLRGMWFEVGDEQQLTKTNTMLASILLEGATESLLPVAIGAVLLDSLRLKLTRGELLDRLAHHGISPRGAASLRTARNEVSATRASWRSSVQRDLLTPPIPRAESAELMEAMQTTRLSLVVGAGGGGKSSVLYQAASEMEAGGAEVLAFRLDRRGAFGSTTELGKQLGLSTSPVASLRIAAGNRDAFLIIDQLDAVSLVSGRLSNRYDVIADLIDEAMSIDGIRVILACRLFDVENDHRIRKLDARDDVQRLTVRPLPLEAVDEAVLAMSLDASTLTASQRELLRSPLNLVLLETVANEPGALNFTSRGSLFDAFWSRKRQVIKDDHPLIRFNEVLALVANIASDQQSLSIPIEALDADDFINDAQILVSEQILAIDSDRVSFFHETFFDYTFARQWLSRQQSLVKFLCAQEQELFRRSQVRQILELLRERDPARFRAEIEAALTESAIRVHIKKLIMIVLAEIELPTPEDVDLVVRVTDREPALSSRVWQQIARSSWFGVLNDEGLIAAWLDSDDPILRQRGAAGLTNAGSRYRSVTAEILAGRRGSPDYLTWLEQLVHRSHLHLDRQFFDLLVDAIRTSKFDLLTDPSLWLATLDLAEHEPLWAIELLEAGITQNPAALATGANGKVVILESRDYGLNKLVTASSESEPYAFAQAVIPYLLKVAHRTAYDRRDVALIRDHHFGFRFPSRAGADSLGDILFDRAIHSLAHLARTAPDSARSLLLSLAADEHEAAQAILIHALSAGAEFWSDWAVELIIEDPRRLEIGYISDSHWVARELLEKIAPHVSDEDHARLENMVRDLRDPYENRRSFGYTAFKFLSALVASRLSPLGARRLEEYRRKFDMSSPPPPTGIVSYTVTSPIGGPEVEKMTDRQWLLAMAKHDGDDRKSDPSVGGARELSQMLKASTANDPQRFAELAMEMTTETNPAYPSAVLWGFGEASIPSDVLAAVVGAIRYIMSLGMSECDRWLGWSVRHFLDDAPLDLVQLVRDRALTAPDPKDNTPVFTQDAEHPGRELRQNGINTARGRLAEELGDLLLHDATGERTTVVSTHLVALATDPVLSVRACVAHTIAACLRHDRATALEAFDRLIEADDMLLASDLVQNLMIYIGNVSPERVEPVINRMLDSSDADVRHAGGSMAAFAALQWERPALMDRALSGDSQTRNGAAIVCSARIDRAADSRLVRSTLLQLMDDEEEDVRKSVGELARHLRGRPMRPLAGFLAELITSSSYAHATPQLLIAIQEAPDKVDDLVVLAAHRFLDVFSTDLGDLRTSAAGDAHYIADLVVRALAQTRDVERVSELLDILDGLMQLGVYGIDEAIENAERR